MEQKLQKICSEHSENCKDNNLNPLMQEIKNLGEKINKVNVNIAGLPSRLEERFDSRYADKHTEKAVNDIKRSIAWVIKLVMGGVIVGVLNLVWR